MSASYTVVQFGDFRLGKTERSWNGQACTHHGHYGTGWLVPRRTAARQGIRSLRDFSPAERAKRLAHRASARSNHAAARRSARPALVAQGDRTGAPAGTLQPGRDV